jgi:hypothetical protein
MHKNKRKKNNIDEKKEKKRKENSCDGFSFTFESRVSYSKHELASEKISS